MQGAEIERKKVRKQPDAAFWGAPPERTGRFSLNRYLPSGGTEKLGVPGNDGVIHYDWPLSWLSVDWIRERWGAGRFQANWLADVDGKRVPRGKSRTVDILGGGARARAHQNGATVVPIGIGYASPEYAQPSPAPAPAPMPPEVVDMRVRAAEEIAAMRIRTERELHQQRLEFERERSDARFAQLEQRLDELADVRRGRRDDDDDDEPDEWGWLKDIAAQFAPVLKQAAPLLLAKLGGGKQIIEG